MARRQRASCTRRLMKKRSLPTKRASGRSRTNRREGGIDFVAGAGVEDWICSPMARAAGSTSLNVASVLLGLVGLTSTAKRVTPGTSSRKSSRRFADKSA